MKNSFKKLILNESSEPYYVTIYEESNAFGPEEGGYVTYGWEATSSKRFNSEEQAQLYQQEFIEGADIIETKPDCVHIRDEWDDEYLVAVESASKRGHLNSPARNWAEMELDIPQKGPWFDDTGKRVYEDPKVTAERAHRRIELGKEYEAALKSVTTKNELIQVLLDRKYDSVRDDYRELAGDITKKIYSDGQISEQLKEVLGQDYSHITTIDSLDYMQPRRDGNMTPYLDTKKFKSALDAVGEDAFKIRSSRLKGVSEADLKDEFGGSAMNPWNFFKDFDSSADGFNEFYFFFKGNFPKKELKEANGPVDRTSFDWNDEDEQDYYFEDEQWKDMMADAVIPGNKFFSEGKDWTWKQSVAGPLHIDFDNWEAWEAISDDGEIGYFVVDVDTEFIDWGPVDTEKEAIEFLYSKSDDEDYEDDYFELNESKKTDDMVDLALQAIKTASKDDKENIATQLVNTVGEQNIKKLADETSKASPNAKLDDKAKDKIKQALGDKANTFITVKDTLDYVDKSKMYANNPNLAKTVITICLGVIAVIEPTPFMEILTGVAAMIPAETYGKLMSFITGVTDPVSIANKAMDKTVNKIINEGKEMRISRKRRSLNENALEYAKKATATVDLDMQAALDYTETAHKNIETVMKDKHKEVDQFLKDSEENKLQKNAGRKKLHLDEDVAVMEPPKTRKPRKTTIFDSYWDEIYTRLARTTSDPASVPYKGIYDYDTEMGIPTSAFERPGYDGITIKVDPDKNSLDYARDIAQEYELFYIEKKDKNLRTGKVYDMMIIYIPEDEPAPHHAPPERSASGRRGRRKVAVGEDMENKSIKSLAEGSKYNAAEEEVFWKLAKEKMTPEAYKELCKTHGKDCEECLQESITVIDTNLETYIPSNEYARDFLDRMRNEGKIKQVDEYINIHYPDGILEKDLDMLLAYENDAITQWIETSPEPYDGKVSGIE